MRILVIDDDRKVSAFIQRGLEAEGHAVDTLLDGAEAAEQAQAIDYDAVVLDLMLPGRSGFQILRDIRARKPAIAVVILTARDSVQDRVTGTAGRTITWSSRSLWRSSRLGSAYCNAVVGQERSSFASAISRSTP
jgi:CheY-like chemotaxis protein